MTLSKAEKAKALGFKTLSGGELLALVQSALGSRARAWRSLQ